ncbi:DNA repair protein RecO [Jejudonia soesokkakensis]|uniref:DNA repair protein RecO n=1 Tax=Jejudonia soesokkakensis TaxID=1323432 RepID=A0ABW2MST1_9FLAO
MVITTRAIVLSAIKYAEADLIVSCFTESSGLKSYLLRGVLKSKRGKLKASYFQPLTQLEIVAIHKDKGTLERIRDVKVSYPYTSLHTDVVKSSLVLFLAEMLKNSIKEEEQNQSLFKFLEDSFIWLDQHNTIANFHLLFLLKLTAYLGFYPDASEKKEPYFNLSEGYFQSLSSDEYCQKGIAVEGLKQCFGINFDTLKLINFTKTQRLQVLDLLLVYYQLHLQGYKKPKSLSVLNQLFN